MSMQQKLTNAVRILAIPQSASASQEEPATPPMWLEPKHHWYLPIKAVSEYAAALLLMILAIPVICVAGIVIKLTSRGPVFYVQTRVGKSGRPFPLIKLRTMVHDAEKRTGPVWSSPDDHRVTGIGRFLRSTHLDEFPQLLNVLMGHMGLIGPRPERPEFFPELQQELPFYQNRLRLRPGITGLAQLQLPPDSDLESVRTKLHHDLYYGRFVSPWLDLRIACSTVIHLARSLCRYLWALIQLPSRHQVERNVDALLSEVTEDVPVKSLNWIHGNGAHTKNGTPKVASST